MSNEEFEKMLDQIISNQASDIDMEDETLKERMWNNIMRDVQPQKRKRRKVRWGIGIALTAVVIILFVVFNANTEPEQVARQSLRDLFIEEKQQEIEIEGNKENINAQLETNESLRYIIYIDEERYQLNEGEKVDRIVMKDEMADDFPQVYMEISKEENTTREEVVAKVKKEIKKEESIGMRREERVTEPIEAEMIQGMGLDETGESFSTEWDTPIYRYYVTDMKQGQVFVIKQVYFLEAAEGHGARFHYMLESFEIVE